MDWERDWIVLYRIKQKKLSKQKKNPKKRKKKEKVNQEKFL